MVGLLIVMVAPMQPQPDITAMATTVTLGIRGALPCPRFRSQVFRVLRQPRSLVHTPTRLAGAFEWVWQSQPVHTLETISRKRRALGMVDRESATIIMAKWALDLSKRMQDRSVARRPSAPSLGTPTPTASELRVG